MGLRDFVYQLYFYLQVGALFSLSCIITPIAQPAASQLSSQRWRESIARRPKSLPSKTVFNFYFHVPFHCLVKWMTVWQQQRGAISSSVGK